LFRPLLSAAARSYFAAPAKRVVNGLIQAGVPPCDGGFMATNWCKPAAAWIRLPKPDALLDAAIFFDFRSVAGNLSLQSLDEIVASAKAQKLFLSHMTCGAMDFYPPLGFFNRLRSENGRADLKKAASRRSLDSRGLPRWRPGRVSIRRWSSSTWRKIPAHC
jgi:CBS domain-containing protein